MRRAQLNSLSEMNPRSNASSPENAIKLKISKYSRTGLSWMFSGTGSLQLVFMKTLYRNFFSWHISGACYRCLLIWRREHQIKYNVASWELAVITSTVLRKRMKSGIAGVKI